MRGDDAEKAPTSVRETRVAAYREGGDDDVWGRTQAFPGKNGIHNKKKTGQT